MKKILILSSLISSSLILGYSHASAQTTLKFDVPADTAWSYVQKISTKTRPLEPIFTPEAGKKVPVKLVQGIKRGLGTSVSATRNVIAEKVTGIKDGNSNIAVSVTSTTTAVNAGQKANKQTSKWAFIRSIANDGMVSINNFKYDATGLKEPALTTLKMQSQNLQNAELARYQQLYGLPLTEAALVGSSIEYNRNVIFDAKQPALSVKVSATHTFKARGAKDEYIFKTNSSVAPYNYNKTVGKNNFTYNFDPAKTSSTETYLIDGRLQNSSATTTSTSTISYQTTFSGVKVTIKLGFSSVTETTTELQP